LRETGITDQYRKAGVGPQWVVRGFFHAKAQSAQRTQRNRL
jgi:hypothetical protein